MVSVLALNKLELRDMITAEMVENPVLEEFDPAVPLLDEVGGREEARDRAATAEETVAPAPEEKKDPFEEIDLDSYFRDYLDPGYRTHAEIENVEKPSFENFLSKPATLTDHLMWQLGSIIVKPEVREAAVAVIGNLDDDGYLVATDDELMGTAPPQLETKPEPRSLDHSEEEHEVKAAEEAEIAAAEEPGFVAEAEPTNNGAGPRNEDIPPQVHLASGNEDNLVSIANVKGFQVAPQFTTEQLHDAINIVQQMDPIGVAARDLRECLLLQLNYQKRLHEEQGDTNGAMETIHDAIAITSSHLRAIQNKQFKEVARAIGRPPEAVTRAMDYLRTLDPRPGRRYNTVEPRLIEPDVAIVKQGDEYLVVMNDDDLPQLRLNPTYKRLLSADQAEKDVRTYVKERYKSAIQLIKNIEQRKQTILKVCYAIIGRQREFLDFGIDQLKPMMIKDVAEEIGVHPSTVSRAVANKYAHTPQGVFELRYFFSESVQGPEGSGTSLLILKRRVKKLIEEEDPARPLTDEQITRILQSQGIQVTRRTVAKYREDMRIPSTHQRRVKN
jgi:RNA polymerase sigma-54 factor